MIRKQFSTHDLFTLSLLALSIGLWQRSGANLPVIDTTARDVGPSAGYVACLGLVVATLPNPWRRIGGWVGLATLISMSFLPTPDDLERTVKLSADLAHLLAFPLGFYSRSFQSKR